MKNLWPKIKSGMKIAAAAILAAVAFILGKNLWAMFSRKATPQASGKIENPNRAKDIKKADRVRADREALKK